jgi:hypothetical protein
VGLLRFHHSLLSTAFLRLSAAALARVKGLGGRRRGGSDSSEGGGKMSQINMNGNFTCYPMTVLSTSTNNGVWKAQDALIESLPLFFSQLFIILFVTRFFFYLLKPLHQPPLIAEILVSSILHFSINIYIYIYIHTHTLVHNNIISNYYIYYLLFSNENKMVRRDSVVHLLPIRYIGINYSNDVNLDIFAIIALEFKKAKCWVLNYV